MTNIARIERKRLDFELVKKPLLRTDTVRAAVRPLSAWEKIKLTKWSLITQGILFGVLFFLMAYSIMQLARDDHTVLTPDGSFTGNLMAFWVNHFDWTAPAMIVTMWVFLMAMQVWSYATMAIPTVAEIEQKNAEAIRAFHDAN
jgi:hypothetical protein